MRNFDLEVQWLSFSAFSARQKKNTFQDYWNTVKLTNVIITGYDNII